MDRFRERSRADLPLVERAFLMSAPALFIPPSSSGYRDWCERARYPCLLAMWRFHCCGVRGLELERYSKVISRGLERRLDYGIG